MSDKISLDQDYRFFSSLFMWFNFKHMAVNSKSQSALLNKKHQEPEKLFTPKKASMI